MNYQESFVFLWGFDENGNPYLDGLANGEKEIAEYARYIELRRRFHPELRFGHIRAEGGVTKKDIQDFVEAAKSNDKVRRQVINKLIAAGLTTDKIPNCAPIPAKPETFIESLRDL